MLLGTIPYNPQSECAGMDAEQCEVAGQVAGEPWSKQRVPPGAPVVPAE